MRFQRTVVNFEGVYTKVQPMELIEYTISGGRKVTIHFAAEPDGVKVMETFEMEHENTEEQQRYKNHIGRLVHCPVSA